MGRSSIFRKGLPESIESEDEGDMGRELELLVLSGSDEEDSMPDEQNDGDTPESTEAGSSDNSDDEDSNLDQQEDADMLHSDSATRESEDSDDEDSTPYEQEDADMPYSDSATRGLPDSKHQDIFLKQQEDVPVSNAQTVDELDDYTFAPRESEVAFAELTTQERSRVEVFNRMMKTLGKRFKEDMHGDWRKNFKLPP